MTYNHLFPFQQDLNFENLVRNVLSNPEISAQSKKKTSLKGLINTKKVFLNSTQLTEQRGLCIASAKYLFFGKYLKKLLNIFSNFFFIGKYNPSA